MAALLGSLFLAWKPGVARSMLGSPRAAGFTVLVGAIVIGIGWWLPRLGRSGLTTGLVQAVPVLLAAVVTVLPAFRSVTVDEPYPQEGAGGSDTSVGQGTRPPAGVVARALLHGIDHRACGDVLLALGTDGSYVWSASTASPARTILVDASSSPSMHSQRHTTRTGLAHQLPGQFPPPQPRAAAMVPS
jgi:hypothetical protein